MQTGPYTALWIGGGLVPEDGDRERERERDGHTHSVTNRCVYMTLIEQDMSLETEITPCPLQNVLGQGVTTACCIEGRVLVYAQGDLHILSLDTREWLTQTSTLSTGPLSVSTTSAQCWPDFNGTNVYSYVLDGGWYVSGYDAEFNERTYRYTPGQRERDCVTTECDVERGGRESEGMGMWEECVGEPWQTLDRRETVVVDGKPYHMGCDKGNPLRHHAPLTLHTVEEGVLVHTNTSLPHRVRHSAVSVPGYVLLFPHRHRNPTSLCYSPMHDRLVCIAQTKGVHVGYEACLIGPETALVFTYRCATYTGASLVYVSSEALEELFEREAEGDTNSKDMPTPPTRRFRLP
ncbi:hypothetical protein KIPB_005224 [Kipferlia bialata]|uniref:Uncharacterized protein n=1 Tax=Kipferlia bialata TaxID=797122 RepID=A0A9K3GIR8_9EUKA|nr:hypothetical protein KIPB_005224 [Kipferlia bialata]|eukprot:g5224.t1